MLIYPIWLQCIWFVWLEDVNLCTDCTVCFLWLKKSIINGVNFSFFSVWLEKKHDYIHMFRILRFTISHYDSVKKTDKMFVENSSLWHCSVTQWYFMEFVESVVAMVRYTNIDFEKRTRTKKLNIKLWLDFLSIRSSCGRADSVMDSHITVPREFHKSVPGPVRWVKLYDSNSSFYSPHGPRERFVKAPLYGTLSTELLTDYQHNSIINLRAGVCGRSGKDFPIRSDPRH